MPSSFFSASYSAWSRARATSLQRSTRSRRTATSSQAGDGFGRQPERRAGAQTLFAIGSHELGGEFRQIPDGRLFAGKQFGFGGTVRLLLLPESHEIDAELVLRIERGGLRQKFRQSEPVSPGVPPGFGTAPVVVSAENVKILLRQSREKRIEGAGLRVQPGEQGFKIGGADKTGIVHTIFYYLIIWFTLPLSNVLLYKREREAQKKRGALAALNRGLGKP